MQRFILFIALIPTGMFIALAVISSTTTSRVLAVCAALAVLGMSGWT
jgi:hypothetical protein